MQITTIIDFEIDTEYVGECCFSSEGNLVGFCNTHEVRIFSINDGKEMLRQKPEGEWKTLAFSSEGKPFAVQSHQKGIGGPLQISIVDLLKRKVIKCRDPIGLGIGSSGTIRYQVNRDCNLVAGVFDESGHISPNAGRVLIWEITKTFLGSKLKRRFDVKGRVGSYCGINYAKWSRSPEDILGVVQSSLIEPCQIGEIHADTWVTVADVWDLHSGKIVERITVGESTGFGFAATIHFTKSGRMYLTNAGPGQQGTFNVWDEKMHRCVELDVGRQRVLCADISPDDRLIAIGTGEGCIQVFNLQNGKPMAKTECPTQRRLPYRIEFSQDGEKIAACWDKLTVWHIQ